MSRERVITAILGAPGAGKTSLLRDLVAHAIARGTRIVALDPQRQIPGGEWPGLEHVATWTGDLLELQRDAIRAHDPDRPGMLVLDDGDLYIGKHGGGPLREIWIANRHYDLDALVTARRAQSLPLELLSGCEWMYLFRLPPSDLPGLERLRAILPADVRIPRERFRFTLVNLYTGQQWQGRTLENGGSQLVTE